VGLGVGQLPLLALADRLDPAVVGAVPLAEDVELDRGPELVEPLPVEPGGGFEQAPATPPEAEPGGQPHDADDADGEEVAPAAQVALVVVDTHLQVGLVLSGVLEPEAEFVAGHGPSPAGVGP
jgi:hypothetical protein